MQHSLDKWLVGNTINNKIAHIFHLDWDAESPMPNQQAVWLDDPISNIKFKKEITWRTLKSSVTLTSNYIPNNGFSNTNKNPNIPVLKSNLQKCVRRNLTTKALQTAISMIELDFLEFIRRLSIIMVEDCILHESFPTLVWMIASYPEWQPNQNHINWLLGIVKYLSDLDSRDLVEKLDFNFMAKVQEINKLELNSKSLIYSLYFRVSYGGLKGDMKMLEYFTELWLARLQSNSKYNSYLYTKIQPITKLINPIPKREIELSSIDFHCYPKVLSLLYQKFNKDKEDIKNSIWFHSSRKTNKSILDGKDDYDNRYMELWRLIKRDFKIMAYKYRELLIYTGID